MAKIHNANDKQTVCLLRLLNHAAYLSTNFSNTTKIKLNGCVLHSISDGKEQTFGQLVRRKHTVVPSLVNSGGGNTPSQGFILPHNPTVSFHMWKMEKRDSMGNSIMASIIN